MGLRGRRACRCPPQAGDSDKRGNPAERISRQGIHALRTMAPPQAIVYYSLFIEKAPSDVAGDKKRGFPVGTESLCDVVFSVPAYLSKRTLCCHSLRMPELATACRSLPEMS